MPNAVVAWAFPILTTLLALPAGAAQFSVVATVPGGAAQIGAVNGATLYGTVAKAGSGTLFSLTTSGSYTLLRSFVADLDGSVPNARLALDHAGDIFGTAQSGGANNGGTLWEYSAGGVMSTPHAFGASGDGSDPLQGPTIGPHYALYGSNAMGAPNNNGILFRYGHQGAYKAQYNFLSQGDGHCPFSGVAVTAAGVIYGTTVGYGYGGNPNGSVWEFTPSSGLKTLYVFQDGADGEWPDQAPVVDSAGNVYGSTHVQNGSQFTGVIWKITAAGAFSVLHMMAPTTDGYGPDGPLVIGSSGNLYGATSTGGTGAYGTVFQITPAGVLTVLHSFADGNDGAYPTGNLVIDKNGAVYGGTGTGTVFKIQP